MNQMLQQKLEKYKQILRKFFTRERFPHIIIVILILIMSIANLSGNSTTNTPIQIKPSPSLQPQDTTDALPTSKKIIEIDYFSPPYNSTPVIANTTSTISVTYKKPLTNSQITKLQISSIPTMNFKKIAHIDKKTVFFRPSSAWKNNIQYLITIRSDDTAPASLKFITTDQVNPEDVIVNSERI